MVDISIVILTKNGDKYLNEVLKGIFSQKIKYKFEVVIIDSGSKDNTLNIISKYPVKIKKIASNEFNHGLTRNLGAKIARGKYIVYLTQDATPKNKYWLENLISPFKKDFLIAGTYSRHVPRKSCNPILARQIKFVWPTGSKKSIIKTCEDFNKNINNLSKIINFSDTSSAIRRDLLNIYPFPKTGFAEDVQWEIKILRAGYKTSYCSDSIVCHSHDYSLIEQLRQNYDHVKSMKKILLSKSKFNKRTIFINPYKILYALIKDLEYIFFETDNSLLVKLKWTLYSPLWHFFVYLGTLLGRYDKKIPKKIKINLSRQENLRRK